MFADDRLMARQGVGVDWQSKGRGSRSDAIRFPWRGHLPSPHPPTVSRGVPRNFSSTFPWMGFVWQMAVSFRSVLRHPGGDAMGGWLPLLRVDDLKGV